MIKQNFLILAIFFILAAVAVAFAITPKSEQPGATPTPTTGDLEEIRTYQSDAYGISFTYPNTYFVTERAVGTTDMPQHVIILAEDTQENRDLFEGRNTEPREGPIAITVDIYENPEQLSPEDWIRSSTNWTLSDQRLIPTIIGEKSAVTYSWSGLYEGKSTVISNGQYTYVVSTTWLTPTDQTIHDYDIVLGSLQFTT